MATDTQNEAEGQMPTDYYLRASEHAWKHSAHQQVPNRTGYYNLKMLRERQLQAIQLMAEGYSNKDVVAEMTARGTPVCESTVRRYRTDPLVKRRIMEIQARSDAGAVDRIKERKEMAHDCLRVLHAAAMGVVETPVLGEDGRPTEDRSYQTVSAPTRVSAAKSVTATDTDTAPVSRKQTIPEDQFTAEDILELRSRQLEARKELDEIDISEEEE